MPLRVRVALAVLAVVTVAYAAQVSLILIPRPAAGLYEKAATNLVFLGAAMLCAWRALHTREERAPWACLAAGLGVWGLGDLYFALVLWDLKVIPVPSPADIGYLGLYPFAFAGLVLLYRVRGGAEKRSLWVDGAVGALALAALGSTLLYGPLTDALSEPSGVVTNLAYPLGDLLLLGLLGGAMAMTGWRLHGAWAWIAAGLAVFAASDALWVYTNAVGTYGDGWFFDAGWPVAALMIARAAWLPAGRRRLAASRAGARSGYRSCSPRSAWRCSSTTTSSTSTCSRSRLPRPRSSPCSPGSRSPSARTSGCCRRAGAKR